MSSPRRRSAFKHGCKGVELGVQRPHLGTFLFGWHWNIGDVHIHSSWLIPSMQLCRAAYYVFKFRRNVDHHYLVFAFSGHITGPGVYALDLGVPNGPDSFLGSGEFVDALLDYRLVTGGFLTVTVSGVPETGGTLFSLVTAIIALFGFHLWQRYRARA